MNVWTSTTVSIFNIFELPKFVDRMYELGIGMDMMQMNNVLTFPDYYNINILPDELKEDVVKTLDNHIKKIKDEQNSLHIKNYYEVIKKYLYTETGRPKEVIFNDFKRHTEIKDKGRNESFINTFPYYKEWYEGKQIKKIWQTLI
jgi:hypothetical protein